MQHSSHGLRIALLAGVSVVALAAAAPSAGAADLSKPTLTKAPPPVPVAKDTWTWWIEGEAFHTDGGSIGLPPFKPNWGGEGAVGFDWQPFAPLHVVGQFRYGAATKSNPLFASFVSGPTTITLNGTQSLREDHWLIDFGIGRDFGLGNTHAMWTLGIRVADLRSKLNASGTFTSVGPTPGAGAFAFQERTSFVGAGPRFGVQGDIPLGGQWSIDWGAGVAVLFGERQVSATAPGGGIGVGASDSAAIFNVDAQGGVSYWFSPNAKFTVGYRFDEYFKALKTLTASTAFTTAGPTITASNLDRSFSGPTVRFTTKF